jgi:hypothetical protein
MFFIFLFFFIFFYGGARAGWLSAEHTSKRHSDVGTRLARAGQFVGADLLRALLNH